MALDLTTLEKVKAYAELEGVGEDVLLADLIKEVSQLAEDYMGTWTKVDRRTEIRPIRVGQEYVSMKGMPITSVSSVKFARTRDFSTVDALDQTLFEVLKGPGQIYFRRGLLPITVAPACWIEVQYTGGMAADTAAFLTDYPRISVAVAREVISRRAQMKTPHGDIKAFETGVTKTGQIELLKDTKAALDPHLRIIR